VTVENPRLRPLERLPSSDGDGVIMLRDPSGFASGVLSVSQAMLHVLALLDGRHAPIDIQARFMMRFGRMLYSDELAGLLGQLDEAGFLDSPRFAARRVAAIDAYRRSAVRRLRDPDSLSSGDEPLAEHLDRMLALAVPAAGRVAGFVAPHLDYSRGGPSYARAYCDLAARTGARRFVILGTNHFGESAAVVGTRKDFETPWGVVSNDAAFMREMDRRCGVDLCTGEFDHAREHSVELAVVLLRHVLGDRPFTIVPYLCPDPCGPWGTRPHSGSGVDLRRFAQELGSLIASDPDATFLIAAADLSHVGAYFHDANPLDPPSLEALRDSDLAALRHIESGDPEAFRSAVAGTGNATNICSVGCIYAAAIALAGRGRPVLRHYHQSVTAHIGNCVSCAAMDFVL